MIDIVNENAEKPKEFGSFYKTVKTENEGTLCKYTTRLDTYGCGCYHDCKFCYAKSLLDFRKLWHPDNPSVANIKKIERKLNHVEAGTVLRLGGMTDCFQPCESKYNVTYETIKLLNERRIHYLIVTKSHLVSTEKYMNVFDKDLAHIQLTVTNTDDKKALEYERASLSSKRLEAWKKLSHYGFDACLRLSPYLKGSIDLDYVKLFATDGSKVLVEFLRTNHWIEQWFKDYADLSQHTLKSGGYNHLPLKVKIEQLEEIKQALPMCRVSVCEDVPDHYDYWRLNNNPNKDDCCNLHLPHKKFDTRF